MEEQFIDVRHTIQNYERAVTRFREDPSISTHNKELVLSFVRDAALGKTVIGRAKKKIGPARLFGYIQQLYPLMAFLQKDLDQLSQADMENFIEALETDRVRSRSPRVDGSKVLASCAPLSPRYKVDIKITVKKFYKWLWGRSKVYPPIVEWIDTYVQPNEVSSLTESEVQRMVDRANTPLQRALIQVLFDGGLRVGELLNIRLRHVRLKSFGAGDLSGRCFLLRVPFSKTLRRTVALPMHATTKWLNLWLEEHPERPIVREDGTLDADDVNAPLFPLTANAVRLLVTRVGRKTLGKRVYPHLLRHTSATYWCNRLPYFKFCKRFGWTMTSKMPQRYIDREGVDETEMAEAYFEDERTRLLKENHELEGRLAVMEEEAMKPTSPREDCAALSSATSGIASPRRMHRAT